MQVLIPDLSWQLKRFSFPHNMLSIGVYFILSHCFYTKNRNAHVILFFSNILKYAKASIIIAASILELSKSALSQPNFRDFVCKFPANRFLHCTNPAFATELKSPKASFSFCSSFYSSHIQFFLQLTEFETTAIYTKTQNLQTCA